MRSFFFGELGISLCAFRKSIPPNLTSTKKANDMKKNTKSLRGLTLMEALLFLGLAAIVIVGAFALYNNASSTTKMNQAKTQLQSYIGGVKTLYASQNSYATVTTALVVNAGIAPKEAVDGATLVSPWGTSTTITGNSSSPREFRVTFNDIPRDACVALLSAGLIAQGTVFQMGVGSTLSATEIDPATAATMCSTTATANDVVFVAR